MTEFERKRDQMIEHLEQALALADELHDNLTGYLIERALDSARAGDFRSASRENARGSGLRFLAAGRATMGW